MKLTQLFDLVIAAELGLEHLENEHQKDNLRIALAAAHEELQRRKNARDMYRKTRPAQTVTRKLIREELLLHHHRAKLNRLGQWHVQSAPGLSWQLFAGNDLEAQENLVHYKEKSYDCTKN